MKLSEEILAIKFAFSDSERVQAVQKLADKAASLERVVEDYRSNKCRATGCTYNATKAIITLEGKLLKFCSKHWDEAAI